MGTGWDNYLDERARREAAEAEVKRLEGLILDWWDSYNSYGPSAALEAEARRIRAQREEGR